MSTEVEAAIAQPAAAQRRPTIAAGSVARSMAEAAWALFALFTGVIVARHLGATGKGMVSSIGYMAALVGPAVTLGLGEAGVTLTRARGAALRDAVGATPAFVALTSIVGAGVLVLFVVLQFRHELNHLEGATLAAVISVPAMAIWFALSLLVEAEGGLLASSAIKVLIGIVTAAATAILVLRFELAVAGAVAAMAGGF